MPNAAILQCFTHNLLTRHCEPQFLSQHHLRKFCFFSTMQTHDFVHNVC